MYLHVEYIVCTHMVLCSFVCERTNKDIWFDLIWFERLYKNNKSDTSAFYIWRFMLTHFFQLIPEPSLLEWVTSYTAFSISLPLLLVTWVALCLVRGGASTVSNSIHKHMIFSIFVAELLYLIALKTRDSLVQNEVRIILLFKGVLH